MKNWKIHSSQQRKIKKKRFARQQQIIHLISLTEQKHNCHSSTPKQRKKTFVSHELSKQNEFNDWSYENRHQMFILSGESWLASSYSRYGRRCMGGSICLGIINLHLVIRSCIVGLAFFFCACSNPQTDFMKHVPSKTNSRDSSSNRQLRLEQHKVWGGKFSERITSVMYCPFTRHHLLVTWCFGEDITH